MGKSTKPLTIFVTDPEMLEWPEVVELLKKGHRVFSWESIKTPMEWVGMLGKTPLDTPTEGTLPSVATMASHGFYMTPERDIDLILGPNCWRMTVGLRRYLPQAIEAARKVRYPK